MHKPSFHRTGLGAIAGLLCLTVQPAVAGNQSRVEYFPLDNNLVEVIADFSENSIYWCGAAVYALSTRTNTTTDMIYVWQGPSASIAKPGETAVQFGFQPPPGEGLRSGFTNDVRLVGNSMTVSQARQTCNERTTSG